jgi:TRAP transporter TAXI family solute receptor
VTASHCPRLLCLAVALASTALAGTACSRRGADETRVRTDLQARLNQDVKPGLFEVVALRREGSSPLPAGESGNARVLVYFNATLKVAQDSTFGGWDQLSPASVAFALGANEKGVFGLSAENKPGDLVRAYGSALYEQGADGWKPVAAVSAKATTTAEADVEGTGPPSRSKQMIDQLAAMVNLPPPGPSAQQDEIIAEELAHASENIQSRIQRREHVFTIATGPADGDYARYGEALISAVNQLAPNVKLRQRNSEGSVDNARLLATGEADYGFIQGDVAAAAVAGEGAFASGELENLRAVGGLFPEAVHVVVLASSPIRGIGELRGRRVNLGQPSSGSRFDALAVLSAYGLKPADLAEAGSESLATAIARLKKGQLDALFTTAPGPTRALQELAVSPGLRLLPIMGAPLEVIMRDHPGLTALTLPPNTYPQQKEAVATVGSATLLVTTADAPATEVARIKDLVFNRMPQMRGHSADTVGVSQASELRGVTIPLHPGAGQKAP